MTGSGRSFNPLAIVSLALGILGLFGLACGAAIGGTLFGLPAIITGLVAWRQLGQVAPGQPVPTTEKTLAIVGVVLGVVEVGIAILLIAVAGFTLLSGMFR